LKLSRLSKTSSPAVAERPRDVLCLLLVTSALDLPLRTNKLCSVLFSSSWSSMLVVINIHWLMRGGVCGKLHGGRSQLLFALQQSWIDSRLFVDNRNLCLPHPTCIDSPVGGGGRRNIEIMFGMEKLEWWKILKICLFTSTESTNVTDGNHMTAYAALMHSIAWQWSVLKYLEAVIQSHKKRKRNRLQYSLFIQRVFDLLQLNHLQSADRSSASLNSDSVYYFWRCLNLHKLLHIVYYFASRILDVKNFPRRSRTTVKGRRRRLYTTLFFAINTVW